MMLRRLAPLAGVAGATALFALMGIAPASAQRYGGSYFSIQYGQRSHHDRDRDRDDRWNNNRRWDQNRYNRDWDDHPRWERNRRQNDWDHDRDDHRNRRHRHRDDD